MNRRRERLPAKRMITMKDVAEKAGVSITTVSHVINQTRFVSDELIDRVNRAIRELDYHPHLLAQSLRRGNTKTIADFSGRYIGPDFCKQAPCDSYRVAAFTKTNRNQDFIIFRCHIHTSPKAGFAGNPNSL